MSSELTFQLLKKNNSFLIKRNGVQFTTEPGNLMNIPSKTFSGLANRRAIDLQAGDDKKGAVLRFKKTTGAGRKPGKVWSRAVLKPHRGYRGVAKGIVRSTKAYNNGRNHLTKLTLARWARLSRASTKSVSAAKAAPKAETKQ